MPDILRPGDIIDTWCSKCGHATPHVYQPEQFRKLKCLECPAAEVGIIEKVKETQTVHTTVNGVGAVGRLREKKGRVR